MGGDGEWVKRHGVLTRAQAVEEGFTREQIDWRVESGQWKQLHRGVYLAGKDEGHATRLAAALGATGGVASHRSAAALLGMDAFEFGEWLDVTSQRRPRLEGVNVHQVARLDPAWVQEKNGFRVTSPVRTLLDLGAHAHPDHVEAAVDYCVRNELTTWPELQAAVNAAAKRGRTGPRILRDVLALRSHQWQHTDSLGETEFLQLIRYAGLPTPVLQLPVKSGDRIVATVDFGWPGFPPLAELIGHYAHGVSPAQFRRDARRATELSKLRQYTVFYFTWHDVHFSYVNVCRTVAEGLGLTWRPSRETRIALAEFEKRMASVPRPPAGQARKTG